MDDLELIFTMLGEASTTRITKTKDVQGLEENKVAARQGGEVAGSQKFANANFSTPLKICRP